MNAIGTITPVVVQAPAPPSQAAGPVPQAPADTGNVPQTNTTNQTAYNPQAADQQRLQAVQRAAQNIANVFVVSDKIFTIFKDSTGQYITRFTSLRDGRVTYVPEPELFKQSGGGTPMVKIEA